MVQMVTTKLLGHIFLWQEYKVGSFENILSTLKTLFPEKFTKKYRPEKKWGYLESSLNIVH